MANAQVRDDFAKSCRLPMLCRVNPDSTIGFQHRTTTHRNTTQTTMIINQVRRQSQHHDNLGDPDSNHPQLTISPSLGKAIQQTASFLCYNTDRTFFFSVLPALLVPHHHVPVLQCNTKQSHPSIVSQMTSINSIEREKNIQDPKTLSRYPLAA